MTSESGSLSIGKLVQQAGVGVETVRFYERECLLAEPERRQSGYRQYQSDTVDRLLFIRRAKGLGFTSKEIKELLSLRVGDDKTCADVMVVAASRDNRSLTAVSLSEFKAQHVAVKSQRPFQIGDLSLNVADADLWINGACSFMRSHWLFSTPLLSLGGGEGGQPHWFRQIRFHFLALGVNVPH